MVFHSEMPRQVKHCVNHSDQTQFNRIFSNTAKKKQNLHNSEFNARNKKLLEFIM